MCEPPLGIDDLDPRVLYPYVLTNVGIFSLAEIPTDWDLMCKKERFVGAIQYRTTCYERRRRRRRVVVAVASGNE